MEQTILEILSAHAMQIPQKIALISEKETLTYNDLWNLICNSAEFLRRGGLNKGEKVVIKAAQNSNYLICYYAIQLAGGIPCCLEKNTPSAAVIQIAEKVNAAIVISETNHHTVQLEEHIRFLSMNTVRNAKIPKNRYSDLKFPNADDTQLLMFTTGTTGASKGVELSFRAMQVSEEKIIQFFGNAGLRSKRLVRYAYASKSRKGNMGMRWNASLRRKYLFASRNARSESVFCRS